MTNIEDIRPAMAPVALANGCESADQAVKSERRREGARKAAATVRARRKAEQAETPGPRPNRPAHRPPGN